MLKGLLGFLAQFTPAFLTLILAGGSYWLALQSELNLFGSSTDLNPDLPDYYFGEFRSEEVNRQSGQTLVLTGRKAEHIPGQQVLLITQPTAIQFYESESRTVLSAQSGNYKTEQDVVELEGQVKVARISQGVNTTIQTDKLTTDNRNGTIYSDQTSTIKQPGRFYQSGSFSYETGSGQLEANGQIRLILENQQR